MKYPLFGIRVTGEQEEITSEYAGNGWYLSHNVFLDYGRSVGITGMLLLGFFFFWPFTRMWRSRNRVLYLPFILAHFSMLIFWMSLSFQFYKTFWALWMLMAVSVTRRKHSSPRRRTVTPIKNGGCRPAGSIPSSNKSKRLKCRVLIGFYWPGNNMTGSQ